ncbi:C40 family peptidase [Desulfonema ishimotonii]|nr:NlpC/P60 family protein [Desulfonema ishimotonii]
MPKCVFLLIAVLAIAGCGTPSRPVPIKTPGPGPLTGMEKYLWDGIRGWQGVPYKWGGNSARGVDCSGLVVIVYRRLFNLQLPRTTKDQIRVGVPVSSGQLRAGDLVFFLDADNARHVGIYLRNRMFIHASKSRGGVVVSQLDAPWWRDIYRTARRVIPRYQSAVTD